jgi:hypothetical protein
MNKDKVPIRQIEFYCTSQWTIGAALSLPYRDRDLLSRNPLSHTLQQRDEGGLAQSLCL